MDYALIIKRDKSVEENNNYTSSPEETKEEFGLDASDEQNIDTINKWVKESKSWHDIMLIAQDKSIKYYHGDQTDKSEIPAFQSDTVYNRIFEATETMVPIITGTAHQFIAIPGEENELSLERAQKLQKVLSSKYEELEIPRVLETVVRDMILKRFGVIKWCWNSDINDIEVKAVDPRLILIPKLRIDANDRTLPYVIEIQEYTAEEIESFFPDVKTEDLKLGRIIDTASTVVGDHASLAPVYQVLEVVTNEDTVWKQDNKILKKIANPYWDFEGEQETVAKKTAHGKVKKVKRDKYRNHLPYPTKNYVFFNPFTTGDAPVAETSLAEISIPIQDDINTQKRQIINNLVRMGNGQVYVDADSLPKEIEDSITSEPGLVIIGKNIVSENRIKREPGTPLPEAHFANLQESLVAFDNVFGTHGAVRGASSSSTLGGQVLNKQQDLSRIEQLTRVVNRGVARLVDGVVQMMKMYYDEEHVVKIIGKDGAIEFLKYTNDVIDDNVVIDVKSGTPPTLDPVGRYNQAIQLWQLNALDPETLFERLDFGDPQMAAQKLLAWRQGQLLLESQIRQQEAIATARATAPTEVPTSDVTKPRNVETPNNVMTRVIEGLSGGGRAPLSNTPKQ